MTDRLHLLPKHRQMLEALLREHLPDVEVWAYGSRVNGRSHDGSDLDLVLRGPGLTEIPLGQLTDFEEAVRESNIPFLVEARDWARLPERFHQEIERGYVVLAQERWTVSGWCDMPLADAVLINPKVPLERGKAYPFVDMAAVNAGSRCAHEVERRAYSGGGSRFRDGDTLMARITPCLENGKIARYCASDSSEVAHGSTEFIVVSGRPGITDTEFAYYLTQWEEVRSYAISQMTGTSGRQRVPTNSLQHLTIPIPQLWEQRAVAHILGTLDDKIELNRRMSETLEAMARAIFKDWFVDFGPTRAKAEGRDPYLAPEIWDLFPDTLDDEGRPVGWCRGTLAEIAESPRRSVSPTDISEDTPYIGLEHMPRRSIALTKWEGSGKVSSNKSVFKRGEFLFGKLRPYFHKIGFAPLDGICSTDIVVVAPKELHWSVFTLACLSSDDFVSYTDQTSTGTKMPRTSWKTMGQYEVSLPPEQIAGVFQHIAQPLLDRVGANTHENRTLVQTRDLLLPKLISGEIRIKDAEQLSKEIA
ncbi:MAG: hypothetical protein M2R45_05488 [Verrucomicrobia subdivision 3 bacterium]|nr:hypothetical protein [Limisphaerales bacterium]